VVEQTHRLTNSRRWKDPPRSAMLRRWFEPAVCGPIPTWTSKLKRHCMRSSKGRLSMLRSS